MRYYLFLPGGFPEPCREDDLERLARLRRHPVLGIYASWHELDATCEKATSAAIERIRRFGRPNLRGAGPKNEKTRGSAPGLP